MSLDGWLLLGSSLLVAGIGVCFWRLDERLLAGVCAGCAWLGIVAVWVLR